jgi:hypothetical protein
MWSDGLDAKVDPSIGNWLVSRLVGRIGDVTSVAPDGYGAYVRVFHPAWSPNGEATRWSTVAAATGRTVHALMQWDAVRRASSMAKASVAAWPGVDPERGTMSPGVFARLCSILSEFTPSSDLVCFALWDGWGQVAAREALLKPQNAGKTDGRHSPTEAPVSVLDEAIRRGMRLRLNQRSYLVMTGTLDSVATALRRDEAGSAATDRLSWQSPNLLWPGDRAWCVSCDIDMDSTIVAGSSELARVVLADRELEAWEIGGSDSLRHDADNRNTPKTS